MVVSLMGTPGTDMELIRWTLDALRRSFRMTKIITGKAAFDPSSGDIGRALAGEVTVSIR